MFIRAGWGERFRQERTRLGLTGDALTHRNTQRSYENEKTAPDLFLLIKAEALGVDISYVVTGARSDVETSPALQELNSLWLQLPDIFVEPMIALARAAIDSPLPARQQQQQQQQQATLHDKKIDYRGN